MWRRLWSLWICMVLTVLLIMAGESSGEIRETKEYLDSLTPLHRAVKSDQTEISKLLIEKGADVNARDTDGKTPLSIAAGKGHPAVESLLREHGGKE